MGRGINDWKNILATGKSCFKSRVNLKSSPLNLKKYINILIEVAGESCKKTIVDATAWKRMEWSRMLFRQIYDAERSWNRRLCFATIFRVHHSLRYIKVYIRYTVAIHIVSYTFAYIYNAYIRNWNFAANHHAKIREYCPIYRLFISSDIFLLFHLF